MNPFEELIKKCPSLVPIQGSVIAAFELLRDSLGGGGTILACGNGGSASDAEHIIGELLKGFRLKRRLGQKQVEEIRQYFPDEAESIAANLQQSLAALSLVSSSAISTAICNDTNPEYVFAQQLYGLGRKGDVLIALSTSGNSKNVVNAAKIARVKGMKVVALTGETGGVLKNFADITIKAPAHDVGDIQELHLPIYHCLCYALEEAFFGEQQAWMRSVTVAKSSFVPCLSVVQKPLPKKIDLVVFDFDGVFTDNKVYTNQNGVESVACDRRDSLGLNYLKKLGIPVFILSMETNSVVQARARKIDVPVMDGCQNKRDFIKSYFQEKAVNPDHVIYMGNDLNDLEAMKFVGYAVAPQDAHPKIKAVSAHVLSSNGGHGAVRELCDLIVGSLS